VTRIRIIDKLLLVWRITLGGKMKRITVFITVIAALAAVLLLPATAGAATWRANNSVSFPSGTTFNDDLYVGGGTVTIDGRVNGNIFVGGGTVMINGEISKSVFIAGGTVTVSGKVGDDILASGGQVYLSGPVANDAVIAGGTVIVNKGARVGRDLLLGSGTVSINGDVGRNVWAGVSDLTLTGAVKGNVRFDGQTLRLEDGSAIGGNLTYTAPAKATIAAGATVAGKTTYHKTSTQTNQNTNNSGAAVVAVLFSLFWFFVFLIGRILLGLVLIALVPRGFRFAADAIKNKPWASLGLGAAVLFVTPFACLLAAITLVGLPLAGGALTIYSMAIYLSMIVTGLWLGRWLLSLVMKRQPNQMASMGLGVFLLAMVTAIPLLGWLASLVSVMFGVGALTLGAVSVVRANRSV
jgi:cytoskeletal protein CcmA (bactofilin family)